MSSINNNNNNNDNNNNNNGTSLASQISERTFEYRLKDAVRAIKNAIERLRRGATTANSGNKHDIIAWYGIKSLSQGQLQRLTIITDSCNGIKCPIIKGIDATYFKTNEQINMVGAWVGKIVIALLANKSELDSSCDIALPSLDVISSKNKKKNKKSKKNNKNLKNNHSVISEESIIRTPTKLFHSKYQQIRSNKSVKTSKVVLRQSVGHGNGNTITAVQSNTITETIENNVENSDLNTSVTSNTSSSTSSSSNSSGSSTGSTSSSSTSSPSSNSSSDDE